MFLWRAFGAGCRFAAGRRFWQQRRQIEAEAAGGIFEALHQSLAPRCIGRCVGGNLQPNVQRRPHSSVLGFPEGDVETAADVAGFEFQGLAEGGLGGRCDGAFGSVRQGFALGHADIGVVAERRSPAKGLGRIGVALEHAVGTPQHHPALAVVRVFLQTLAQTGHCGLHFRSSLRGLLRFGRPFGKGHSRLPRCTQPKINPDRGCRQGNGNVECGEKVRLPALGMTFAVAFLGLTFGCGQQATFDLGARCRQFLGIDGAALRIGLQFA